MAFNFPSNPALNDTYTFGDRTWTWNGAAWQLNTTSAGAINGIPVGNVTPSSGAFTTMSATGNITGGNVLSSAFYFANGDPFVSGGAANLVIGTRTSPIYVALATATTLDVVGRSSNVTVTLTT